MEAVNGTNEYRYSYSPTIQIYDLSSLINIAREKIAPLRFELAAKAMIRELALPENSQVLELGSGLGLLGKAIKSITRGKIKYFGVELAYKSAQTSLNNGIMESQADIKNIPFASNTFDGIVSTDVLEHVNDDCSVIHEMFRILKPGGKAFVVIADPIEPRFNNVHDHINRTKGKTDVEYWQNTFRGNGFEVLVEESNKYRDSDWRKILNLPFLVKLKEKPGFACAFNPVNRPGTYVLRKPENFTKDNLKT